MGEQLDLGTRFRADGSTFDPKHDAVRLGSQLQRVRDLMLQRPVWRTLPEIKLALNLGSEAGISARLRDLRKPRFGSFTLQRRRRGDPKRGLWEYRVLRP